ncbi:MAG: extracellular solute-binding protein [Candidatus Berkelbacteria bacterium]|nr:extracellular solute-binding protein [Candidatus Berkelbacteria bacterium]
MLSKRKIASSKWNKFLKVFGTSTLAVAMALSLTGCGTTTTTKPNSLIIWGFVDEDVFSPIIKDFKNQNKGIDVKYYKKTLDASYEDNALNSILSGQGPDVWAMPNDWVYRHKDKLAAMPATMLTSKKIVAKDYFANVVMQDNVFDNQIYGLTPTIDILHVYYNPTIFDATRSNINKTLGSSNPTLQTTLSQILSKFPITWDEFNKIVPYLTVKNGSTITTAGAAIGTSNNVRYSQDILSLLMLQNQTNMLSDDLSQATFNLPIKNAAGSDVYPGKNSLDFYTSYSNPAAANYSWNSSAPNDIDAFVQGKVAIIFGYSDTATYLRQVYPNFQFQQALMPQVGDINSIVDYAHYTSYVVPEASPNTALAWQFVQSLSTDEASTYRSATKEISSKKTETDVALKNRGAGTPSQDQIKTAQSWNKGRYPVDIDGQFKQAIDRFNSRTQSSQAALDTAAANVTELLRKAIW